ncbi:MAG TPA: alpha/beta hydrolase [Steroidobacteraceae bacterium]|jgi:pimeloyl-ACP methyl ester carboxylesterase
MKRSTRLALALALAAVVLGTQWLIHHPTQRMATTGTGGTRPTHYRLGHVDFTPCELKALLSGETTAAWCAPFVRPENPADPAGRRIHMRLALIRSSATQSASDVVVFLAGGPGESAVDDWAVVAPALKPVLEHRDVVLLDQRGTGESHPLLCPKAGTGTAPDPASKPVAALKPQQAAAQREARQDAETRACLSEIEQSADPRFYTTTDDVNDLIALRHALGDPQYDLIGASYGTRVAQQYAMRDPAGVRSIVLDSVLPNSAITGEDIAGNLEDALKADFTLCRAEPACAKAFGDPYTELADLRARIDAHPPVVTYRDPATGEWRTRTLDESTLDGVVRLFAYSPLTSALLPLSLHQALAGDYGPLMGQSNLIRGVLGHDIRGGLQWAVLCSEDVPLLKPNPADKDTLLGSGFTHTLQRVCALWPRGQMPADFHQPLSSAIPTLILEGQYDPITPPRYGRAVLAHLGNARLLIARGQGHGVLGAGCMPRLVGKFVDDPQPRRLDAVCLDALRSTPPFVNFNGATP